MTIPSSYLWISIVITSLTLSGCAQSSLRDKQLQVFERNLKSLRKAASDDQSLIRNRIEQVTICKRSLQLCKHLTPAEISSGRYDTIFWRYHLIRNLLLSHKHADSPGEEQHKEELSSLAAEQLSVLAEREYSGLRVLERAPSYEQLGSVFLELGKIDPAEKCLRHAIQLYETTFGKKSVFLIPSLADLIELNERKGNIAEAATVCKRLIQITMEAPGQPPLFLPAQYFKLADLCQRLNKNSEANEAFREGANLFNALPSSSIMASLLLPDSLSYMLIRQLPPKVIALSPELFPFYKPGMPSSVRMFNSVDLQTHWRFLFPKTGGSIYAPGYIFIYADVLRHCLVKIGKERALRLFPWAETAFESKDIMSVNRSELPRKNIPYTKLSASSLVPLEITAIPMTDWVKIKSESKITKDELAKIWKVNSDDYIAGVQLQSDPL